MRWRVLLKEFSGRDLGDSITPVMCHLTPIKFGSNAGVEAAGIEPASADAPV